MIQSQINEIEVSYSLEKNPIRYNLKSGSYQNPCEGLRNHKVAMSVAAQTKVRRYWPGKAPEGADENDEGGDIRLTSSIMRKDDPRLRRLAQSRIDNRVRVRENHKRIRQAEIDEVRKDHKRIRVQAEIVSEEEDEDAMEQKRRKIREKLLLRRQQEEAALIEESESEYETDSEEVVAMMVKAVFVPKSNRDTIAARERVEAEEQAVEEEAKRRIEARKKETKEIVVDKIKEDLQIHKNIIADDVDVDEAEEYEAWKAREIARIRKAIMLKEKKVRNMIEEERRERQRKNITKAAADLQRFMQRDYHQGAFFLTVADNDYTGTAEEEEEEEAIYTRDFSCPTGEDKMDKTILPKVMQVKHFGLSGRTKWTNLVNEDTTDWNTPWTYNDALRAKYNKKWLE